MSCPRSQAVDAVEDAFAVLPAHARALLVEMVAKVADVSQTIETIGGKRRARAFADALGELHAAILAEERARAT